MASPLRVAAAKRNWPKAIEGTDLSDNGSFNTNAEGLYDGGCASYGQWHKTFDNYKESTIDGKTVTKEQGTTTKGSLVLTLKSSYLDTLSEGEHKIKVSFTDGEALATVNIGKAKGMSLPKTGDTSVDKTPLAWMLIITAAAGITMTVLIEKKRHK